MTTKYEPSNAQEKNLLRFASTMSRIPRRALRCDLYGTVSAVVDERHALNIFRKLAPYASTSALNAACQILQDRLDESGENRG